MPVTISIRQLDTNHVVRRAMTELLLLIVLADTRRTDHTVMRSGEMRVFSSAQPLAARRPHAAVRQIPH
jgi:hypothetical protein